jgi:hypothetical protein
MSRLAEFFDSYYRLRPVNATFTGIHDYDDRLPDWSPDGLAAAAAEMRRVRDTLVAMRAGDAHALYVASGFSRTSPRADPSTRSLRAGTWVGPYGDVSAMALDDVAVRDRELAISFLDVQLAEDQSLHFQRGNPSLAIGEAAFGVISLMTRRFGDVRTRAPAAASRLAAVPAFLDGARQSIAPFDRLRAGGVPDPWRAKCLRECDGVERLFGQGVATWIESEEIPSAIAADLTRASSEALAAVADFRRWLERDVQPAPADRLACGPELFDLLLSRGHWCETARLELKARAADALDEELACLHDRARNAAPGGWLEVQQRLSGLNPKAADYLETYQRIWDDCRQRAEECELVTWPDSPIRYVPIPVQTREAAPFLYYLFYRSPAPFDGLPMHDYMVPASANISAITLNHVVHHGAIGHHVQNYYAYRGASEIGRVAAVDCASRIGMFLGGTMAEGWACYATDLMDESGFLTPDESIAQQHTRARLLARAVVDIGLHDRSLSFDDAVAIYRDRIGMAPDAALGEACKNSMFPGTAVMYWLGTEAIHQLRRDRERADGAAFSLRRFHDRLLSFGSIPVPLIARVWS